MILYNNIKPTITFHENGQIASKKWMVKPTYRLFYNIDENIKKIKFKNHKFKNRILKKSIPKEPKVIKIPRRSQPPVSPWFAPAGLNRGVLGSVHFSPLRPGDVKVKLKSTKTMILKSVKLKTFGKKIVFINDPQTFLNVYGRPMIENFTSAINVIHGSTSMMTLSASFLYDFGFNLHKEDGPANTEWYKNGQLKVEEWYKYRFPHNEYAPARIWWYENGRKSKEEWWKNGKKHRSIFEPSVIEWYKNGKIKSEKWYVNDVDITSKIKEIIKDHKLPHWKKWTTDHKLVIKMILE